MWQLHGVGQPPGQIKGVLKGPGRHGRYVRGCAGHGSCTSSVLRAAAGRGQFGDTMLVEFFTLQVEVHHGIRASPVFWNVQLVSCIYTHRARVHGALLACLGQLAKACNNNAQHLVFTYVPTHR